jgi:hypothetical protein
MKGRRAKPIEYSVVRKAHLCVHLSRTILGPRARVDVIEDQAIDFMSVPEGALWNTYNRLNQLCATSRD